MPKPTKKKSTKPKKPKVKTKAGLHDAREVVKERRYETRTLVTNMTFAAVSFQAAVFGTADFAFKTELSGLLVDTSEGGCSLIFMKVNPLSAKFIREVKCVIQIAPGEPRMATVRWVKDLDGRLRNAGFAYS